MVMKTTTLGAAVRQPRDDGEESRGEAGGTLVTLFPYDNTVHYLKLDRYKIVKIGKNRYEIYHTVNRLRSFLSLCHLVTRSLSHLVTRSLGHAVTRSLGHSVTQSLGH